VCIKCPHDRTKTAENTISIQQTCHRDSPSSTHSTLGQRSRWHGHKVYAKHFSWRRSSDRREFALYRVLPSSLMFAVTAWFIHHLRTLQTGLSAYRPECWPRCQSWGKKWPEVLLWGQCLCGSSSPEAEAFRLNRYKILSVHGRKFNELDRTLAYNDSVSQRRILLVGARGQHWGWIIINYSLEQWIT